MLILLRLFTHLMRLALLFAFAKAGNIMLPPKPPRRVIMTPTTGQMIMDIIRPPTARPVPLSPLALFLICTRAMMARMKPMQLSPGKNAMMNEATAMPEVLSWVVFLEDGFP